MVKGLRPRTWYPPCSPEVVGTWGGICRSSNRQAVSFLVFPGRAGSPRDLHSWVRGNQGPSCIPGPTARFRGHSVPYRCASWWCWCPHPFATSLPTASVAHLGCSAFGGTVPQSALLRSEHRTVAACPLVPRVGHSRSHGSLGQGLFGGSSVWAVRRSALVGAETLLRCWCLPASCLVPPWVVAPRLVLGLFCWPVLSTGFVVPLVPATNGCLCICFTSPLRIRRQAWLARGMAPFRSPVLLRYHTPTLAPWQRGRTGCSIGPPPGIPPFARAKTTPTERSLRAWREAARRVALTLICGVNMRLRYEPPHHLNPGQETRLPPQTIGARGQWAWSRGTGRKEERNHGIS
jgi:hypothetical protein